MSGGLRLLHVFPGFGPGGTELRMVRIMAGMGPRVTHTILPLNGNSSARDRIPGEIRADVVSPPPGAGSPFYALEMSKLVKAIAPDLVLTYNWGAMDAVIGARLASVCPVIHNECGFGPDEAVRRKRRRIVTRFVVLSDIHLTLVTSRNLLRICLEEFRLPRDKVRWIRTGVDVEHFRPRGSRQWRESLGVPDDELLFGFVGALRGEKNLPLLLRAFRSAGVPKSRLVLVGEGGCRSELEALARESGLGQSVLFAGYQADPAVCLAGFDVFVMSSSTEQTSNAMLEAMAAGLPVISTDVGDAQELLGSGDPAVLVPPGNEPAYAAAIRAMAASAEVRAGLGASNRNRAVEYYSNQRMIQEYAAVYYAAAGKA